MIDMHQTCPKHYMYKHSAQVHTLQTKLLFLSRIMVSKAFCQMLWKPWSSGPWFSGVANLRSDSRSRYPMHSLRIRPKALKKAEDSTDSKKRKSPKRFHDSGKVTTKTVVLDEWVIKSSSGYTITPVRFTLNPFKPKSTFQMEQHQVDHLGHMI